MRTRAVGIKAQLLDLSERGMFKLEKPANLSFLTQILFELSQKKTIGGGGDQIPPPHGQKRVNRKTIASLKGTIRVILSDSPCAKVIMPNLQGYSLNLYLIRNVEDTDVFLTIFNERCR